MVTRGRRRHDREDEVNGAALEAGARPGARPGARCRGSDETQRRKGGGRERDATEVPASSGIASRAGFPHQVA